MFPSPYMPKEDCAYKPRSLQYPKFIYVGGITPSNSATEKRLPLKTHGRPYITLDLYQKCSNSIRNKCSLRTLKDKDHVSFHHRIIVERIVSFPIILVAINLPTKQSCPSVGKSSWFSSHTATVVLSSSVRLKFSQSLVISSVILVPRTTPSS